MGYKWYVGVPHSHTVNSDGALTIEQLVRKAKRNKLDYIMITDHNKNCNQLPETDGLTLIYGTELTKHGGHTNIWGVKDAVDNFDNCETYEDWLRIKNEAKRRGAVICMNHPWCMQCHWNWEKDIDEVDVLEVWNSPQHYDNMVCTDWWHELLKQGKKVPVVGGSDYHRDYVVTNLLAVPATYVYARSSSPEDILDAIVKGRTTISNSVGQTFINITCGENILGDTVKIKEDTKAVVTVKKLKKNHTLHVFDQSGEIFTFKAKKTGDYTFDFPIKEAGFICAHTTYVTNAIYKIFYDKIIVSKIPSQKGMKLPPFIYAQSGSMYFEK